MLWATSYNCKENVGIFLEHKIRIAEFFFTPLSIGGAPQLSKSDLKKAHE